MTWKRGILFLIAVLLWAGCGDDDSTGSGEPVNPVDINGALVIPSAWAGTWEITLTFRDCATDQIRSQEVITSLACPGDTLVNPFVAIFEDCDGTRTGNHLEASCHYQNASGACQITMDLDFTMDVNGNSLSGSGTIQTTATPECGTFFTAGCEEVVISGTRLSTDTSTCPNIAVTHPARRAFLR
ncbi:MAG TPA: hypothetical protein VEC56_10050 [Candidatus Krumholzibacteria bacterium]|nr:hypothetical protein [Candidatus Krumholzibacteria bacterium]